MTCKCGSDRIAYINGKTRDLNSISIDHLNFEHDGYMMDIGVGSADYIEFDLCLDCGQVQGFTPVTDEMIMESEEYNLKRPGVVDSSIKEPISEYEKTPRPDPQGRTSHEAPLTRKYMEKKRVITLMQDAFGPLWQKNEDAIDILKTTLGKPESGPALREAIEELLNESSFGGNN